jgi:serine/threonine protein kinase
MIGRQLLHYRILKKLGAGGMGEVYLAVDSKLQRRVAIKILPVETALDPESLARLEREAQALAALNHPNIVTVHSVEHDEAVHFLTMELLEGESLKEVIRKDGLPLDRILEIAIPLTDGIATAHENDIIHRDLKPANIMVTKEGRVKILDFGIAKVRTRARGGESTEVSTQALTIEGVTLGTLPYMSPEQVEGGKVDERSDVFSLGVILYEMATGERPFHGENATALGWAILRDRPAKLDRLGADLPDDLNRIVRRCLEKDPEKRYQTAKDVRNELQDLPGDHIPQRVERRTAKTIEEKVAGPPKKKPWVLFVGAGIAVAVGAVSAVMLLNRDEPTTAVAPVEEEPQIHSLAVLPFTNLMNDPDQDYFVAGMHEALITDLSKITSLRVVSRTSSMLYKESGKPLPQIAGELNVDALIEGSVFRDSNRVRITAQLIHGATDSHLWAEDYDRDLENALVLTSEVAQAIAGEIRVALSPDERSRLASAPSVSVEVQETYLRANYHFHAFTGEGFLKAQDLYRTTIELDSSFARGYVGLAITHFLRGSLGHAPHSETVPLAEAATRKALELNPNLAPAHTALGWLYLGNHWDWARAEAEFKRALELNPSDAFARHGLADYYLVFGDMDESVRQIKMGHDSDPFSPITMIPVVGHLAYAGRHEEALAEAEKFLELFPQNRTVHYWIAEILWSEGRYDSALVEFDRARGKDSPLTGAMRREYSENGTEAAMRVVGDMLVEMAKSQHIQSTVIASYYARGGAADQAFQWLDRALEERVPLLLHVGADPDFATLRSDPRFAELLRRMGFPDSGIPTTGEAGS